jgi:hypothetical protein
MFIRGIYIYSLYREYIHSGREYIYPLRREYIYSLRREYIYSLLREYIYSLLKEYEHGSVHTDTCMYT